nr:uncharacterized protein LOC129275837 [Lytechinus pictus]
MGHLGVDRVLDLARQRFYWPNMQKDVEHFIHHECSCLIQRKPNRQIRVPMVPIVTSEPLELISIDFVHLETSKGGYEYILVVVDHFTRYAQAYPTRNKSGQTAADRIFNDFVLRFGFPRRILHDQGGEFENRLFHRLQQLSGVQNSRTTPYHPQGNGKAERFNRTRLSMLRTLTVEQKSNWKEHLLKVVHAYNSTRNEATGYAPAFLMFGRTPRLPIDLAFGLNEEHSTTGDQKTYAQRWKTAMREAYDLAKHTSQAKAEVTKKTRDKGLHPLPLEQGDRVLVRNMVPQQGPSKLRSYWEKQVHIVKRRLSPDIPVYEVCPEIGQGRVRVLHRNMLLPCDYLGLRVQQDQPSGDRQRRIPRALPQASPAEMRDESGDSDDEEVTLIPVHPHIASPPASPPPPQPPSRLEPRYSLQPTPDSRIADDNQQGTPQAPLPHPANIPPPPPAPIPPVPMPPFLPPPPPPPPTFFSSQDADLYDSGDCCPPQQDRRNPPRRRQPPPVLTYTQLGEPQQWRRDPNVNMVQTDLPRMNGQPGLYYPQTQPHQRMMHQADPWSWDAGLPRGQQQVRIPHEMPLFISRPAWDAGQFQQWQPWMTRTPTPQPTFSQN